MPGGLLVGVGGEQPALGVADLPFDLGRGGLPAAAERLLDLGALLVGQQPLDHAPHVGLVVDRVAVAAAEHAGVLAQQPRAHGVEGGGGHAARPLLAEQVGQPQAQFAGGAHAEGDREDLPRRRAAGRQQVGDAAGEGAGLARPGPGHEQQRPVAVLDRGALLGREVPGEGARLWCRARAGGCAPAAGCVMHHLPVIAVACGAPRGARGAARRVAVAASARGRRA